MKKKKLIYMLCTLFTLGLAGACNDDNENVIIDLTTGIDAVYKGTLILDVDGQTALFPQTIHVARVDDEHVKLVLSDTAFNNMVIKEIPDAFEVAAVNGKQAISGTSLLPVTVDGVEKAAQIEVTGGIIKYEARLDMAITGLGATVTARFVGVVAGGADVTAMILEEEFVVNQPMFVNNNIIFYVGLRTTDEQLKTITPIFEMSSGATITPAGPQDFTAGNIEYTVTSADKLSIKKYIVKCKRNPFDFEDFFIANPSAAATSQFYGFSGNWDTSNPGISALFMFGDQFADKFCVTPTKEAKTGEYAVRLETLDTKGGNVMGNKIPKISSGSLFLGKFVTVMEEPLKSTQFGVPVTRKPLRVTGQYKYTPGTGYYICADPQGNKDLAVLDPAGKDSCAITAVLYKEGYVLNGLNLLTENENVIAKAELPKGGAKPAFTSFILPLKYTTPYDPAQKYKLAVVFSSSKHGDRYSGAPGSVMVVDDVEVVFEE